MLRIIQNTSNAGAKSYYSTADYYTEGQELVGQWRGEGATRLGLKGKVRQEDWDALCDNRNPATGEVLTARQKDHRRVGYDFNFHVPKSVSVLYSMTSDERILEAFRESVEATMRDMEAEMKTRVRAGGQNADRVSGNMVWGEFVHFTSRPVDGVPDPHLHAHCFVFNTTWDGQESRWKAGQFADLKRDAPYFEAVFHSRLARRMEDMGLPVERTAKGWEIAGIPTAANEKFSRRTALIEATARDKGITDEHEKGELGAKTRERKRKDLTLGELREEWRNRLTQEERDAISHVESRIGAPGIAEDGRAAGESVVLACDHCLERKSVAPEREVLAEAMRRSFGAASPNAVEQAFRQKDLISAERDGRRFVTTAAVLEEERNMLDFARRGRGTSSRLGSAEHTFRRTWLNDGQRRAVIHVLDSTDRVILVRGAAGVGKTTMMQESVEAIEAGGSKVFTFAPSANASRGVLRKEGFENAETVARLLQDPTLQEEARGQVLWIDEAGLLGTKTTAQLFELAGKIDARVILSGDRRQHGSVERGAALRLLETEAGLMPAEIKDIQRQKGAYKQAVQALSEGRTEDGLTELDRLGWVRESDEGERYKALAHEYVASVEAGKSALVVSPTHIEGEWVTGEIRRELHRMNRLGGDERELQVLRNANLTQAQRADRVNYLPGDVLVFHQNAKGYRKGQRLVVGDGKAPLDKASRFQAFHPGTIRIAQGDLVRVTQNGKTADGLHRLNNGAVFTVKGFTPGGDIALSNGWTVSKDFGHLAYGYVVTSHASQGKTVDRVFIGQSSQSFRASSREQFYVSVSRAREQATIYTDDKEALRDAVSRSDERLSATELMTLGERDAQPAPTRRHRSGRVFIARQQAERSRGNTAPPAGRRNEKPKEALHDR